MNKIGEMSPDSGGALMSWLVQQGLDSARQEDLLEGYCQRLTDLGVPLMRVLAAQRGLHPTYGAIGFTWRRDGAVEVTRFERSETPQEGWLTSPFYHLVANGLSEFHLQVDEDSAARFPVFAELLEQGGTDYFLAGIGLADQSAQTAAKAGLGAEGVLISLVTDAENGFSDAGLREIRRSLPYLGLALKSAANRRMAHELLGVYLGADAGGRVLSGEIGRGSLERIDAAILFFDLIGFTSLAEQMEGAHTVAMLNDYFGVAVRAIEGHGGNVLKFMGDGLLAMFDLGDGHTDAAAALATAEQMEREVAALNATRTADGEPTTGYTLALHNGEVYYGNIGADDRLDFTVIGAAVNQTARLSDMHRSVGRNTIVSESFRNAAAEAARNDLVSLGRYMLRGVPEPQELFTLYRAAE